MTLPFRLIRPTLPTLIGTLLSFSIWKGNFRIWRERETSAFGEVLGYSKKKKKSSQAKVIHFYNGRRVDSFLSYLFIVGVHRVIVKKSKNPILIPTRSIHRGNASASPPTSPCLAPTASLLLSSSPVLRILQSLRPIRALVR